MSKKLELAILFDIYSPLLTDKQRDTLDLYYNEDLSLAEIAETAETTRQAVMNCIRKSEQHLMELEEKMQLAHRSEQAGKLLDRLDELFTENVNGNEAPEIIRQLREII